MDYSVYKFIHLIGIAGVIIGLGGAIIGARLAGGKPQELRKLIAITHGVGLFLVLLGGFGMLARLGIHWPWPWWIMVKFGLWIALGAWLSVCYRSRQTALSWFGTLVIFAAAAGVVLFRGMAG